MEQHQRNLKPVLACNKDRHVGQRNERHRLHVVIHIC